MSRRADRGVAPPRSSGPSAPTKIDPDPDLDDPSADDDVRPDTPWVVVVWDDPVNLMSYVVMVFQKVFGFSREKATRLMLDVHRKGKAAVSEGTRERAEVDVARLHSYGLWATMEKAGGGSS